MQYYYPPLVNFSAARFTQGVLILVFIVLYKLGDALVNNMSTPFCSRLPQTDIGAIQGGMGLIATIVGALAGGSFEQNWH